MSEPATVETLSLTLASLERVAERIVALELEPSEGQDLPRWTPGSHIDVHLGDGIVRQYSLSTSPVSGRWRLGVLHELSSRGGSTYVHTVLAPGATVTVSRPRNTFAFEVTGRRVVFVAGGIGVTPILSMLVAAESSGLDWQLLYLGRSPDATAFVDELSVYREHVHVHYDSQSGPIDLDLTLDDLGAQDADVYACGPGGLLDALQTYASARDGAHLVVERFSNPEDLGPREGDHAFTVELADGTEIRVAVDETVLEALERERVPVLNSCREGTCGTCETVVFEGTPDHRDVVLSQQERDSGEMMMPCVSRCIGPRIVLDL